MSMLTPVASSPIVYPDSDGQPMAENTLQFRWIVTLEGNLEAIFRRRKDVFVAGDNLIYPVEGHPEIRMAPDVYIAFGRPKGDRGSYRVWQEDGIFPQVIFEVLSPGNRRAEMFRKFTFYERHGAEEYYVYDPDRNTLEGYVRGENGFEDIATINGWVSPLMGIQFDMSGTELVIYRPDGKPFLTFQEILQDRDAESQRAEAEKQRADQAVEQNERLRAMLRAAGIDPDGATP